MEMRLLHFESCPYCEKVRYALRWLDLPFQSTEIDPADREEVLSVSGQPLVPVLVDGEIVVSDSSRILRYLVKSYGGGRLLSNESRGRGLAWILEEYADEVLGPLLRRVAKGSESGGGEAERNQRRADLEYHYQALEQALGDEEFLLGSRMTLADIALYAFLSRVELYDPRGIPGPYVKIRGWYQRMKR